MKGIYSITVEYDDGERIIRSTQAVPEEVVRSANNDVMYEAYWRARQQVAEARRAELED